MRHKGRARPYLISLDEDEARYLMSTQRENAKRANSAKDREFEELLRRAALYAKAQSSDIRVVARRKRVKAAAA
jgi:hypothetical protein